MSKYERKKQRKHARREAAGQPVRAYEKTGLAAGMDVRDWKRAYKRMQREKTAAAAGRALRVRHEKHDAHVVEFLAIVRAVKFDAHVRRAEVLAAGRKKCKERYDADSERARKKARDKKHALVRSYVVQNLVAMGIPRHEVTPEIINIKREQILLRRLSRDLKHAAANVNKEES